MDTDLFPELDVERDHLSFARRCRDSMIQRFLAVDPSASADEITSEYVEVTVAEALEDLHSPGAGDFFGRITDEHADRWYIGRRHIEDDSHDPVVVDWRAPIAAPFYRATGVDPLGLSHRRRFTMVEGDLSAYLDEQLDDPDSVAATGVPDPVLAEIGAARTGAMREIVATIQAEQDVVIRAPLDQVLVVQGGPGTGKTAVGLHRAAFLLFEHRRRLSRTGVLVVGPNTVFLDYIANVLPSLGERLVQQRTALDICVPKVEITGIDDNEMRRWKGSPEMLDRLAVASVGHVAGPTEDLRLPIGARTLDISAREFSGWVDEALHGVTPVNKRREGLKGLVVRELMRRTDRDDLWERSPELRAAVAKAWPTQQPIRLVDKLLPGPSGKKRRWTVADQFIVDEANSMLNGTPFTFGHVVVDEAQDHSAVSLRVIGRRSPQGSMTILGDLAQSTTPAGQQDWTEALGHIRASAAEVAVLTIGYRVPGPILEAANRLLPFTQVSSEPSRSVRLEGSPPVVRTVPPADLFDEVAEEVIAVRHRHHNTGVVAPAALHEAIGVALAEHDLRRVDHVHDLAYNDVPVFTAEAVKGLEFDGVVVVNAHQIFDGSALGARLLYVAMTRAVQVLHLIADAPLPQELELYEPSPSTSASRSAGSIR
ncbi:MAG TPA: ATP-binding domain-containing protein [Ilumatobacteraceae bacterium]|nr:ATP-binding domain-containing protein [Ilumatobacteraceae bacterium]